MVKINLKQRLKKLMEILLYPEDFPCVGCRQERPLNSKHLCDKCADALERNSRVCPVCGRSNYKGLCDDCRGGRSFIRAVAPYKYKGSAKGMVMSLKYRNATHVARLMALEMAEAWSGDVAPEVMTCVPSSEKAFIKRGFNQSYLIAEHLSKLLDIPFEELLDIEKRGINQHLLTRKQRKAQNTDNFICTKEVNGKRVLLVDDVLTTGSTADACAKALVKQGAAGVYVLVFATVPYSTARAHQSKKDKDA